MVAVADASNLRRCSYRNGSTIATIATIATAAAAATTATTTTGTTATITTTKQAPRSGTVLLRLLLRRKQASHLSAEWC